MPRRSADSSLLAWLATALAAISLALVIVNGVMFTLNQSVQAEVNNRQQFINQSIQLARVEDNMARALATAAAHGDDKIKDLLAELKIGYTVNPPDGTAAPAAGGKP